MRRDTEIYRGEVFWRILAWTALIVIMLWAAAKAEAQEQYIRACQSSYACQLDSNVPWSAGIRTYVFTPLQPNMSLRIWIHNNNTTSAHTAQTLTLWITNSTIANASLINQSDIWVQATFVDNVTAGAQCASVNANNNVVPGASGMATCYANGMYAAQVAVRINPGGAAIGSPDTFDIGVVQQPSVYASGPQPGADSSTGATFAVGVSNFRSPADGTANNLNWAGPCTSTSPCNSGNTATGWIMAGYLFNSATWDRVRGGINADAIGALGMQNIVPMVFDGTNYDRIRSASSADTGSTTSIGAALSEKGGRWTLVNQASGGQATASRAASATLRHVIDCYQFSLASAAAVVTDNKTWNIRDGASGAGTIIWQGQLDVTGTAASATSTNAQVCGLNIIGTLNTAMTCEFAAASPANVAQTVSCSGYDVQ